MKTRPAEPSDIPRVLELIQAKADFDGYDTDIQASASTLQAAWFSENPKAHALVAESEERVIGIATYCVTWSTFLALPGLWLDDLFVDVSQRSTGSGKALMQHLCSIAQEQGCGRIEWIVARDNALGRRFYDSLGAKLLDDIRYARLDESAIARLAS